MGYPREICSKQRLKIGNVKLSLIARKISPSYIRCVHGHIYVYMYLTYFVPGGLLYTCNENNGTNANVSISLRVKGHIRE